jgi:hypothetical protein
MAVLTIEATAFSSIVRIHVCDLVMADDGGSISCLTETTRATMKENRPTYLFKREMSRLLDWRSMYLGFWKLTLCDNSNGYCHCGEDSPQPTQGRVGRGGNDVRTNRRGPIVIITSGITSKGIGCTTFNTKG